MDPARVLTAFREELIAAGVARRPSGPGSNTTNAPYPFVIEPREGAPAPGELSDEENDHAELVVSLILGGEVAPFDPYDDTVRRRVIVDVRYRSADNAALRKATALDEAIKQRLNRVETNYGVGFVMGTVATVNVHAAQRWAGFGPISRGRDRAYDHVSKWLFEVPG